MLKIPTFVLGGLLILTGLLGYLFQDPSLSIKIKGSLADDAKLTLSDGNQTQRIELGFVSGKESAGDQAKEIITRFYGEGDGIMGMPPGPATKAAQNNNAIEHYDKDPKGVESFWYASSRGDTLGALIQENENYLNVAKTDYKKAPVNWDEVDVNSSTITFVYVNAAGNSGPATLKVSNWKNIDVENPPENDILEFKKSWTALIPAIIGLVLILLVLAADAKPSARKHVMHVAVLIGLAGFIMVAMRIGPAVAEMTWLRGEPNGIIQASSLKPTAMLVSAGLLLIFVILCVASFIQARKEMAAQAKKDALAKKKAGKGKPEEKGEKKATSSKESSDSKGSKGVEENREKKKIKDTPKDSNKKDDSGKPKHPNASADSAKKSPSSTTQGLPDRKPVDKKEGTTDTGEKKDSGKEDGVSREKPREGKSVDPEVRKASDRKPDKDASSPASKEPEKTPGKKERAADPGSKTESGEGADFSDKKPDDRKDNGPGERKDSAEESDGDSPSPLRKESEETREKKEDATDNEPKKESGEPKDSPDEGPEEK
ncbi:MAG: hypothetical protein HN531_01920 [Opitutae bacterium]|nr:hypothetical protein [Opitutae bacterium]